MANLADNMGAYGVAWFSFDEGVSTTVIDNIANGVVATITGTTIVKGLVGNAREFDGSSKIQINNRNFPTGKKSVRFKIKMKTPSAPQFVISNINNGTSQHGLSFQVNTNGAIYAIGWKATSLANFTVGNDETIVADDKWHDVLFTWDGTNSTNAVKLYVDDMSTPKSVTTATEKESTAYSNSLNIGSLYGTGASYFVGQLDELEIYNEVISPIEDKSLVYHEGVYKYFKDNSWESIGSTVIQDDYLNFGMNNLSNISESKWRELIGEIEVNTWTDFQTKKEVNLNIETEPFTLLDEFEVKEIKVIEYTDHPNQTNSSILLDTEPYNVYDYISETPNVLVYTESIDDILVSTTTEPFDLYDELEDEVEVLYYTDNDTAVEANLILEANWSPLDELDGDFEVVTWTDESPDTAQRVLEMTAIPKPQFVRLSSPAKIFGDLEDLVAIDGSKSYRDEVRYFLSNQTGYQWYVWNKKTKSFVMVNTNTQEDILKNGMKYNDLAELTKEDWSTWKHDYISVGIFLKDNPRDTIVSAVQSVSFDTLLPVHSTTIQDSSLYILNTTAKIDIEFNGNLLKGILSDDDLTRVQYRVLLNGGYYYPSDGQFTQLGESPQNIELVIGSKDVKIDDWNTIKVEFQDFFGTTDYWSTQFIGTYSGLMFKDVYGQYYSSEIGEVLQYLDFGIIIAGQTTLESEVLLKNQYGYDVNNIHLYANTSNFPQGMSVEFSETQSPFIPQPELKLARTLLNNEEMSFFIRLKTELGATPDANGSFDIIVKADRA